jgi:aspartyl-tRNA(Asn)/glutamyl-tRNA(Gln) amidotransferase subunit A
VAAYYIIQPAEVSSNLGRYDGIKYGLAAKDAEGLVDFYFKTRNEGFGDEAKRRIMLGTYVLSAGYYESYYLKAQKVRAMISQDFDNAFSEIDFILSPVSPTTAFKIGEKSQDPWRCIWQISLPYKPLWQVFLPCLFPPDSRVKSFLSVSRLSARNYPKKIS